METNPRLAHIKKWIPQPEPMETNPRLAHIKKWIKANGGWSRRAWRMPRSPAHPPAPPPPPRMKVFSLEHECRRFIIRAIDAESARTRLNFLILD